MQEHLRALTALPGTDCTRAILQWVVSSWGGAGFRQMFPYVAGKDDDFRKKFSCFAVTPRSVLYCAGRHAADGEASPCKPVGLGYWWWQESRPRAGSGYNHKPCTAMVCIGPSR